MKTQLEDLFDECSKKVKSKRWIKVVTLGCPKVGKSSLIKSYCENKVSNFYRPTVGIDYGFKNFVINGDEVAVTFWDMGGDDDYQTIRKELYANTDICLLVYDESRKTTFLKLDQYFNEFKANCGGKICNMVVIGNKIDVSGNNKVDLSKWKDGHKFKVHQVSALDISNVRGMFNHILSSVM